jgi:Domain of unknown function (DUF4276)
MVRLNITAEGASEEIFVEEMLRPHLLDFGKFVEVRQILTNRKQKARGGMPSFKKIQQDITQWIKEQPTAWHTTMIDLYGLKTDFPGYVNSQKMRYDTRVLEIERQFAEQINHWRFIPYIQLHEYEALLFSGPDVMEEWLSLYNDVPAGYFSNIRQKFDSPEQINDSVHTAPSKRIIALIGDNNYDKVDDGLFILKEIGLDGIRKECPHFNAWLTQLENLA